MIYTSYFGKMRSFPENVIPVAICAKVPAWYKGSRYSKLAPKYEQLMKYKDDHDADDYEKCFRATTLEPLSHIQVLHDLHMQLPVEVLAELKTEVWNSNEWHIALLCYEKPSDFCHRHLVSEWLRKHGVECKEYLSLLDLPDQETVQKLHEARLKISKN